MSIEEQYGSPIQYVLANWGKEMYFLGDGRTIIVGDDGKHTVVEPIDVEEES